MKQKAISLILGQRYQTANGARIILTQRVSTHQKYRYLGRYAVDGVMTNVPAKWMAHGNGVEAKGQNGWDIVKMLPWPRVEKNVNGHFVNIALMKQIAHLLQVQGVRQVDIAKVLGAGTGSVNIWLKKGGVK